MQYALRVSRDRVRAALNWLFAHNRLYIALKRAGEVELSEANLEQYAAGEGAVPDSIAEWAILTQVDVEQMAEQGSGYTKPDLADSKVKTEPSDAPHLDATGSQWSQTGIVDVDSVRPSSALRELVDRKANAASFRPAFPGASQTHDRVMIVPAGSYVYLLDRKNPDVDHGAFPTLFPYGVGGPTYPRLFYLSGTRYMKRALFFQ